MSGVDNIKAFEQLKIDNEFTCEKHLAVNAWECKGCKYFYMGYNYGKFSACLLRDIKEWALYRIESED